MTTDSAGIAGRTTGNQISSLVEWMDRLVRFEGPPTEFLRHLLAGQCELVGAAGGAVVRLSPESKPELLAMHPMPEKGAPLPVWVAQVAESAQGVASRGQTTMVGMHGPNALYGEWPVWHVVVVPLGGWRGSSGVAGFHVRARDPRMLEAVREKLEMTAALLTLYETRLTAQSRDADLGRLRAACELASAVGEPKRFAGFVMALVNEVAARWQCERVSLGFLRGRYVRLAALSHTEKFSRKQQLVQDLERAMEECVDQDVEIVYPNPEDATYVSRATEELSKRSGPTAVISFPLRREGEVKAVLLVERSTDRSLDPDEAEALRLGCELVTARLVDLYDNDRWFGARMMRSVQEGAGKLLGAKHTGYKAAGVAILAVGLFLLLARGEYRVESPFVLEARERQVVPAPFDGYLKTVSRSAGQRVEAGEELAGLDTAELRLELAATRAKKTGYETQATAALSEGKMSEAQIAQAQAQEAQAQISLLEYNLERASIRSPVTGTVLVGDLERELGRPVKTGDLLFQVAPLEALGAELYVPEDQISDIREGGHQQGELAVTGHPGERVGFTVERVNPVAEVIRQRNVFRVRAKLDRIPDWMKPGMEGMARVTVDRRPYAYIWTRSLVNWVRMKLWW